MLSSILNCFIILFFPYCCYFIYLTYSKIIQKEKTIFLDLTLLTSFYFSIRVIKLPIYLIMLVNLSFIISMYKNKKILSFILLLLCSIYFSNILNINISIILLFYILIYVVSYFYSKYTVLIYSCASIVFSIIISILYNNNLVNFDNIFNIIIIIILSYMFFKVFIILFDYLKSTVNVYETLDKITKEKKLYESLFKITHEIKNPLAVCKGYLDMIDVNNKPKANKYIGIINQEINRTLILLKDFSAISKLDIRKDNMDINLLLEDVCDEAKILFNNVKFIYNIPSKEEFINGDYNRLKQVFINLLKNSKESIIEKGEVLLWTEYVKNRVIINIKDNGSGISSDDIKYIGKPFYTTKKEGTGLGICFSKEIIEKHNGSIEYISNGKDGTLVKVSLPLKKTSS